VNETKTVRVVVDLNFFIFVNEKNKLAEIQFVGFLADDIRSNDISNFVNLSAMLRHFLNRNDVNFDMTLCFKNKDKTKNEIIQHELELKSTKYKNERLLNLCFTEKFVIYKEDYDVQELYDYVDYDFKKFDFSITPQTAQLWLEYLNKFAVDINMETE